MRREITLGQWTIALMRWRKLCLDNPILRMGAPRIEALFEQWSWLLNKESSSPFDDPLTRTESTIEIEMEYEEWKVLGLL